MPRTFADHWAASDYLRGWARFNDRLRYADFRANYADHNAAAYAAFDDARVLDLPYVEDDYCDGYADAWLLWRSQQPPAKYFPVVEVVNSAFAPGHNLVILHINGGHYTATVTVDDLLCEFCDSVDFASDRLQTFAYEQSDPAAFLAHVRAAIKAAVERTGGA